VPVQEPFLPDEGLPLSRVRRTVWSRHMASARSAIAAGAGLAAAFVAAWSTFGTPVPGRSLASANGAPAHAIAGTHHRSAASAPAELPGPDAAATIAVIDTGADLSTPTLASAHVSAYDVGSHSPLVTDANGHGTFVASIAAATTRGAAPLLIVKAAGSDGTISSSAEAAGIRYAVDHGARVVNLSLAGVRTSAAERDAVAYAVRRGALVVAAAGNDFANGNPVEYPAALLQRVGSNGLGGDGLVVGASTRDGARAAFSASGSWISLAAPGTDVGGDLTSGRGAATGSASGTSFAAPQVAGAAALVWGADPALTAAQVAQVLKATASGGGTWTPDLGYGVIDVAAAVARAHQLLASS
jgi:subtilisin family serine protease